MSKKFLFLPLVLIFCAGIARSQIQYPKGSLAGSTTVASLPLIGNSNLLWDVRDGNPGCAAGSGTTRVVCHWNGATYDTVGTGSSTVTSVTAANGVETTTGSPITSTGTIRGAQPVRSASGVTVTVLDSDRGKILKVTNAGGPDIEIAQAGTAGAFAAGWYCDILVIGAGGAVFTPTVSTINGAGNFSFSQNQTVRVASDGTNFITTLRGGASAIAGTPNAVAKFNGAGDGVVGSRAVDDPAGAGISLNTQGGSVSEGINLVADSASIAVENVGGLLLDGSGIVFTAGTVRVKFPDGANYDVEIDSALHSWGIGDTNDAIAPLITSDGTGTLSISAASAIPNTTPLWKVGATGAEFEIDGSGTITRYEDSATFATNTFLGGDGHGPDAIHLKTFLAGTGIALTPAASSITIAQTPDASIALTAQSTSIGATNIQVNGGVAPAGLYRISYYLVITTAGTSGTVSATFGWSDPAAARTSGSGNVTFGTLAAPATGSVIIRANGVANITYLTTVTAAVGSPAYALYISLERLQ